MEEGSDAMQRYLTALRERSGLSWADLSAATGLPDSTIRKIFSGETADPRLETISLIVTAMGGSLDVMKNGGVQMQTESATDTMDAMRADYEKRIADIKASAAEYAKSLQRDKRILSIVAAVLVLMLIAFLAVDLTLGSMGWIRH
jgi:transcriptional regulator with XRE-family HTH domain